MRRSPVPPAPRPGDANHLTGADAGQACATARRRPPVRDHSSPGGDGRWLVGSKHADRAALGDRGTGPLKHLFTLVRTLLAGPPPRSPTPGGPPTPPRARAACPLPGANPGAVTRPDIHTPAPPRDRHTIPGNPARTTSCTRRSPCNGLPPHPIPTRTRPPAPPVTVSKTCHTVIGRLHCQHGGDHSATTNSPWGRGDGRGAASAKARSANRGIGAWGALGRRREQDPSPGSCVKLSGRIVLV